MKIAVVSYWSCPLTRLGVGSAGGMSVYILNIANQLEKLGIYVDIYTRQHPQFHYNRSLLSPKIKVIHIPGSGKKVINHYQNIQLFAAQVLKYIKKNKIIYDLIHSHYYYSGLSAILIKDKLKLPIVQTFHTLGWLKKRYAGISDSRRIAAETKIVVKADKIVASTELERDDLIKFYRADPAKVLVISPAVNHRLFHPLDRSLCRKKLRLPKNKKIILFVGRIDPVKGITFLISAVSQLSKKFPTFKNNYRVLLIGGDIKSHDFWQTPEVVKIVNLIKEKNLDCCTKFLGSIAHQKLPFYYSAADVVVLPSVYESFGLVILEAMACAACILASKAGALGCQINDKVNGLLFEPKDPDSLADKLWQLLKNDKNRHVLAKNAFFTSRGFNWNEKSKQMLSLYKSITNLND